MTIKGVGQKILHFSVTKIMIGIIVVSGIVIIGQMGIGQLLGYTSIDNDMKDLITGIVVGILAIFSYALFSKFFERRYVSELSSERFVREVIAGISLGVILQSLTIFVIYLKGGFSIVSVNSFSAASRLAFSHPRTLKSQ